MGSQDISRDWPQIIAGFNLPVGDPDRTSDEEVALAKILCGASVHSKMSTNTDSFFEAFAKGSVYSGDKKIPPMSAVIINYATQRLVAPGHHAIMTWALIARLFDSDPRKRLEPHEYLRILVEILPGEFNRSELSVLRGFEDIRGPSCVILGIKIQEKIHELHMNVRDNKLYMIRVVRPGHLSHDSR